MASAIASIERRTGMKQKLIGIERRDYLKFDFCGGSDGDCVTRRQSRRAGRHWTKKTRWRSRGYQNIIKVDERSSQISTGETCAKLPVVSGQAQRCDGRLSDFSRKLVNAKSGVRHA
jgi:hypothetical protein